MATSPSIGSLFSNPVNDLLFGLSGAAGAFPTPGSSTTSGTQNGTYSGSSNPILSAQNQTLLNQLTNQYSHLAQTGVNLQPYQIQQQQQINNNSNIAAKASQESLAARGLAGSPVAGTVAANQDAGRINQITNLQQSIPLLQNQMNLSDLGAAAGFASSIPHGTDTSGNTSNTTNSTTQTQQGGGAGGFLGGLGKALGSVAGLATTFSDKDLKDGIVDSTDGLDKVLKMKPKMFNYKDDPKGEVHSGFVAQDIEKLFPEAVEMHPSGFRMIKHEALIPKIVKSIQEMHDQMGQIAKNAKNTNQTKKEAA